MNRKGFISRKTKPTNQPTRQPMMGQIDQVKIFRFHLDREKKKTQCKTKQKENKKTPNKQ